MLIMNQATPLDLLLNVQLNLQNAAEQHLGPLGFSALLTQHLAGWAVSDHKRFDDFLRAFPLTSCLAAIEEVCFLVAA